MVSLAPRSARIHSPRFSAGRRWIGDGFGKLRDFQWRGWQERGGFSANPQRAFFWYFLTVVAVVSGIVCGALSINVLNPEEKHDLLSFLSVYLRDIKRWPGEYSSDQVIRAALSSNLKMGFAVWALGATVALAPLCLVVIFVRGFLVGFGVGFLVDELGWKGALLAAATVFPHNAVGIPALILAAVGALSFAWYVAFGRRADASPLLGELGKYVELLVFVSLLLLLASALESHASFPLMKLLSRTF